MRATPLPGLIMADLITTDPIMAIRVQSPSPSATGHTMFAALDIGTGERITPGGPATGHGDVVSKFGSTGITSCEDIKPRWGLNSGRAAHRDGKLRIGQSELRTAQTIASWLLNSLLLSRRESDH